MKNAMKRWLSLLLTVLMVATALPFAALAEGETAAAGLIEEDLVPVEPEQAQTTPTVNVSNAVSAAELLNSAPEEASYLEQIAVLQTEAEALDAESETLMDDCADIYARLMSVYESADAEHESGTMTDEEYEAIYNAIGAVIEVLSGYGYDPYAVMTLADYTMKPTDKLTVDNVDSYSSTWRVVDSSNSAASGITVSYSNRTLTITTSNAAPGTYTVQYKSRNNNYYNHCTIEVTDGSFRNMTVSVVQGGSASAYLIGAGDYTYGEVKDSNGNVVSGIAIAASGDDVNVTAENTVAIGSYTATYYATADATATKTITINVIKADTTNKGTFKHIEIEVSASASVSIDGVKYSEKFKIAAGDEFTVTARQAGVENVSGFTYTSKSVTGNGSNNDSTVEISGTYPTGNISNPVYYTVSTTKDITFYKRDSAGNMLDEDGNVTTNTSKAVVIATLPVVLQVTVNYWMSDNACPGLGMGQSNWQTGDYIQSSGIDYPISGDAGNLILTKGKMTITKDVTNDASDSTEFTFYVQNSAGKYVTFDGNAYSGLSDTLTSSCYVKVKAGSGAALTDFPVGGYKVTEIQQNGYIIANINDKDTTTNYSTDFIHVTKDDEHIAVAAFKNKKLSNNAGISIKKEASGIVSGTYPNPTISIVDSNGNAKWTGAITANADRVYLPVELEPGTYTIVETNQDAEGYSCVTSLSATEEGSAVSCSGMQITVTNGRYDLTVTNVYTNTTSVTATKVWNDKSDKYGMRPAEISLQLMANESEVGTAVLNEANDWTYTWSNLSRFDANGNQITYTVTETAVPGYTTEITGTAENGFTVTNTLKTHTLTIKKQVEGNMGSWNKQFAFTTSYGDGDKTANLVHDGTAEYTVPYGATVTVTEDPDGYTLETIAVETGNVTPTEIDNGASFTMPDEDVTIIFTNSNEAKVDTGILLDSLPYVLILALVAVALVVWFARRRRDD